MAIVDDAALYALGYWMHESHPSRIDGHCLNTRQHRMPCDACTQACPKGIAIHEKKIDWHGCDNCNRCVTACPSAALCESTTSLSGTLALFDTPDEVVTLACKRYAGRADVKVTCLGTVPWDLVAAIACKKRVVLKVSPCKDCPDSDLFDSTRDMFKTLKRFFGASFKGRILSKMPDGVRVSKGSARRRAFEGATSTLARAATSLVAPAEEPEASQYRAVLLDVLGNMPETQRPELTWLTLVEDGLCKGCGLCVKVCPHHALELRIPERDAFEWRREEEKAARAAQRRSMVRVQGQDVDEGTAAAADEDASVPAEAAAGETQPAPSDAVPTEVRPAPANVLIHDASRCTQCGLCYLSCPEGNLGGWNRLTTRELPARCAHEIDVRVCEKCGRVFRPDEAESETLCLVCQRSRRR